MRGPTCPKRRGSTKKPSLVPRQEASKARRGLRHIRVKIVLQTLPRLSDISRFHAFLSVINSAEDEREV